MARFESLLKWINTFDGISCNSSHDLISGHVLLECLHRIMPDIVISHTNEPWKETFPIFEEFCGCTLEKAVSMEKIKAGDQEHIARVVVMLLCVAVQSRNNEAIVTAITSLDYDAQRDIMFFIESALAKVKSHAIVAGTFTSGVGEPLPALDTSDSPTRSSSIPNKPDSVHMGGEASSNEESCFRTPHKPSRPLLHTASFYNGLDSTAGVKLLMSPAITGRSRSRTSSSTTTSPAQPGEQPESAGREEISRLKHSVRVLEGTLQVEKKLAQEYYTELCGKILECEELKNSYGQLERKVECLREMGDVRDELDQATLSLAAAEKSVMSYKSKIEMLEGYRERTAELEAALKSCQQKLAVSEDYRVNMERLEKLVLEKESAVKHLELELSKATIETDAKSTLLEGLLQENGELRREAGECRSKCRQLEEAVKQLDLKVTSQNDSQSKLLEEKHMIQDRCGQLEASLEDSKKEASELKAKLMEGKTSMAACNRIKEELQVELTSKVSQLASRDTEVQSLARTRIDLETQVAQLKSDLQMLEVSSANKEADLRQEIAAKASALATQEGVVRSLENQKGQLEGHVSELERKIDALEQDNSARESLLASTEAQLKTLGASSKELERQISQLQSANRALRDTEVTSKVQQISSLQSAKSELETKLTLSRSKVRFLEKEVATKNSELDSKDVLYKSLENVKTELEAQLAQLRSKNAELQQAISSKEEELTISQGARREVEQQVTQHQHEAKTLSEANASLMTELATSKGTITLLQDASKQLEAELTELHSVKSKMERDKASQLATSRTELSSLVSQRDDLLGELEAVQKDLVEVRAKESLLQTQLSKKEGLLATLTDKHSTQEGRLSQLIQELLDKQSSLQSAQELTATLRARGEELEGECVRLRAEVQDRDQTIQLNTTALSKCRSELESSRRLLLEYREHRASLQEGGQVQALVQENLRLQSQQARLWEDYDQVAEREKTASAHCQELEARLAARQEDSRWLRSSLGSVLDDVPGGRAVSSSGGAPSSSHPVVVGGRVLRGPSPDTEAARLDELKRRNTCAPPHLKSSYPIEMQVRPETTTSSDDGLKFGAGQHTRVGSILTLEQLDCSSLTTTSTTTLTPVPASASTSNLGGQPFSEPSGRRQSAPPTPDSHSTFKRRPIRLQGSTTLCPSMNLRDFLDSAPAESKQQQAAEQSRQPSATAFEVAFSPPKKSTVPKRLQENKTRRSKAAKEAGEGSDAGEVRRETVVKKRGSVPEDSKRGGRGKKWFLRQRN